jgi:hypothetical protein
MRTGDPAGSRDAVSATQHERAACATLSIASHEFACHRRHRRVRHLRLGAAVAGLALGAEYIGDFLAALALGIVFQYLAIAPMPGLSLRQGRR